MHESVNEVVVSRDIRHGQRTSFLGFFSRTGMMGSTVEQGGPVAPRDSSGPLTMVAPMYLSSFWPLFCFGGCESE